MNTRRGKAKFKNFLIILDSGCISTIVIGMLVGKYILKNMLWCSVTHNLIISILILRLKCNKFCGMEFSYGQLLYGQVKQDLRKIYIHIIMINFKIILSRHQCIWWAI